MNCKVAIGKSHIVRHSIFESRDAAGSFHRYMPEMTADDERLQASYLGKQKARGNGGWIIVAALVALGLIVGVRF